MPDPFDGLHVVSAEAVRDVLEAVAVRFTARTGCAVSFAFMTAGQVRAQVLTADLAIASGGVADELVNAGTASAATPLGRIGLAVAIAEQRDLLDIDTAEKLVATLKAARAVAYTDPAAGGTAGLYFGGLLKKLGIADEINGRAVFAQGGRDAAERVANGEAELAITFPSEINPVPDVKVGGLFPQALQNYVTYAAIVPKISPRPSDAVAFVEALTDSSAQEDWRKAGFEQLART